MTRRASHLLVLGLAAATGTGSAQAQSNAGGRAGSGLSLEERTNRQIQDYKWDEALATFRAAVAADPKNAEAWRGLGRVLRWKGRLKASREAYLKAAELHPETPEGVLGVASAYRYDHNFKQARLLYDQAVLKWGDDAEVRDGVRQMDLESRPRAYLYYEDDLSFETRKAGLAVPLFSREEVYADHEEERRPDTYLRTDEKIGYLHYFGIDHLMEISVRLSNYDYPRPQSDFAAIDTFAEIRLKYTMPILPDQVVTVRYTHRPTRLEGGQKFAAKKIEAELRSQWSPRFTTVLGTGGLRDLDEDATSVHQLRNTVLVRAGFEYAVTSDLQLSANYITNPDLDNTIDGTTLAQVNYRWSDTWSSLYRFRYDNYKRGSDQTAHYVGMRYSPIGPLWAEFGLKAVSRGDRHGIYPLISVVYRCGFCRNSSPQLGPLSVDR